MIVKEIVIIQITRGSLLSCKKKTLFYDDTIYFGIQVPISLRDLLSPYSEQITKKWCRYWKGRMGIGTGAHSSPSSMHLLYSALYFTSVTKSSILKEGAALFSVMPVYQIIWRHIKEDDNHCRANLKSRAFLHQNSVTNVPVIKKDYHNSVVWHIATRRTTRSEEFTCTCYKL